MIENLNDLKYYITEDGKASRRTSIYPRIFGDYVWKYQLLLRLREYEFNCKSSLKKGLLLPFVIVHKHRFSRIGLKCGFSISLNTFGPGLSIAHYGTIIVNSKASVGKNCRIQTGVTIGATNGQNFAP